MIRIFFDLRGDLTVLAGAPHQKIHTRQLPEPTSVKDALEGLGIPHTEIDLLLLEGQPLDFTHLVSDGQQIEVHPVPVLPADATIWPTARLQPRPLFRERFVCDQHLGKLARWLRLLGYDTAYGRTWGEADLARIADEEARVVLTCSKALLKRKSIGCGRLIRSRQADHQAVEVVRRFDLTHRVNLFGRCTVCNGELSKVDKALVMTRIPPRTRRWREEYYLCGGCDRVYWEGSHVEDLRRRAGDILACASVPPGASC